MMPGVTEHQATPRRLGPLDERRLCLLIAAETDADLRSVKKVLRGEAVRGVVGERIRAAFAKHCAV
jgi:hypothetical protein